MKELMSITIFMFLIALHIIIPTLALYKRYIISTAQCVYICKTAIITTFSLLILFVLWCYTN